MAKALKTMSDENWVLTVNVDTVKGEIKIISTYIQSDPSENEVVKIQVSGLSRVGMDCVVDTAVRIIGRETEVRSACHQAIIKAFAQ